MIPCILFNWLLDSIVLSSIAVITLIYYFATSTYKQLKKLNVPHTPPVPLFGNVLKMVAGLESKTDTYGRIYRQHPDAKICGFYEMRTPFLMIRDPEIIQAIMIKDFNYFINRGLQFDPSINLLARSLFFANGQKWKIMKQKLNPGFTSVKLKGMLHNIKACSDRLVKFIEDNINNTTGIEVSKITGNFSTDVIGTCAFGLELDTINNDSEFRKNIKKIFGLNTKSFCILLLGTIFPNVVKYFKLHVIPLEATNYFHSVFNELIEHRTTNDVVRNDIAQELIKAKRELVLDSTGIEKFTDSDIISNAIFILTGGSEPVAATLAFCFYELALNRDIQNKIREEITSTNEKFGGQFTNELCMNLPYTDMVLNETHRKYSVVVNVIRETTQTYKVPGMDSFIIEKGQKIVIPMSSIHHDPKYYPNPKTFDPERFTKEEISKRPNGTFFPFGEGPRHCIGKRFAEWELKLVLSIVLTKFEIFPCPKTEIPLKFNKRSPVLVQAKNGIWLNFKPIVA